MEVSSLSIPLVIEPVSSKKMEVSRAYPLMSLNQWALKNGTSFFFGNTQLVSKELDIVNLEVIQYDNPEI